MKDTEDQKDNIGREKQKKIESPEPLENHLDINFLFNFPMDDCEYDCSKQHEQHYNP